jgi:membrane protein insertase Oxa1/YidC/SpoIIIJ
VDGVQIAGDLVAAIPYFIAIILVMATAWYQQKQTMARSKDQNQPPQPGQAVMKIFPFFFGFISFNMPAGLVVYFAASQIFRIGQQALIISLDDKHAAQRAAEAKEAKKHKPAADPTPSGDDASSGNPTTGTPSPKRRPQGSKKKRGNKRRRR